jgi:hypothetical protein
VTALERGGAALIEQHLRVLPGVCAAWVTPSIDGQALISVSYDPRRITPDSLLTALLPVTRGLAPITTSDTRTIPPEDQCVC